MFLGCRLAVTLAAAALLGGQEKPEYTFGTTVVSTSGFEGLVYFIPSGTEGMPKLDPKRSVGKIYTTSLNVPPRPFRTGFPGIASRFEWFAIDYSARVWIEREGRYHFRLLSDDGAILFVDGETLIDNGGIHAWESHMGSAELSRGIHTIRVTYFQGPGAYVALVLEVALPGRLFGILNTNNFNPPVDPSVWVEGKIRGVVKYERNYVR